MVNNMEIVRLYGKQDMVKQFVIKKMYGMGSKKLEKLEAHGLERYPYDGAVYYSITEVEEKIKELSSDQR